MILLCLSLFFGLRCVQLAETFATNDAIALQRNFKETPRGHNDTLSESDKCNQTHCSNLRNRTSGSDKTDQIYSANFSDTTSGFHKTDQLYSAKFSNTTSGPDTTDNIYSANYNNTNSGYDKTNRTNSGNFINPPIEYVRTETYRRNGEFIDITSGYDTIDTTLNSAIDDDTNETYRIDLHSVTLLSNTTFNIHEPIPTTPTSDLINTTYDTNYRHAYMHIIQDELGNNEANNESKLEIEVGENQRKGNAREEIGEDEREGESHEEEGSEVGETGRYGEEEEDDDASDYSSIIYYTILTVIGLVGMVANVCLCMIFVLRKEMRTFPNLMVMNLTVSDILCIIINIPIAIVVKTSYTWQAGDFLCKTFYWVQFLTIGSSVYSVVVISLQRFFALTIFFKMYTSDGLMIGKWKNFLLISSVWVLAGGLALRYSIDAHVTYFECYINDIEDENFRERNDMVDLIVYCVIPLAVIGFSTAVTSILLKRSAENMPGEVSVINDVRRNRVVSSNVLLALIIVFAISYFPIFSYYVCESWGEVELEENMEKAFHGLLFANSCLNPISLFIMSRKYRRILLDVIRCRKNKAPRGNRQQ